MRDALKDIAVRAAKTFVQALLASLAVANLTDFDSIKAALIAAVAAGISAVWNTLLAMKHVEVTTEEEGKE